MKMPTAEEALKWATDKTMKLARGEDLSHDTKCVLMLLHYIRKLEKTAPKEDVLSW